MGLDAEIEGVVSTVPQRLQVSSYTGASDLVTLEFVKVCQLGSDRR